MRIAAALVLIAGCSSSPASKVSPAPKAADDCVDFVAADEDRVALFSVVMDDEGPILQARGLLFVSPARLGATFAIIDDVGFIGVVARGDPLHRYTACYDAPCPMEWRARWIEKPMRTIAGWVTALGPKGERFRKAKRQLPKPVPVDAVISFEPATPVPTTWVTEEAYDVDGDGAADVETRVRCCPNRKRPLVGELRERTASGFRVALRVTTSPADVAAGCASDAH